MTNIVLFGAPGSGKGTQSDNLKNRYGLYHISTGELLRDHIARHTDLGRLADKYISKGQLIPDDVMIEIIENVLDEKAGSRGIIFDGFPRTEPQAEALDRMLAKHGFKIDVVIGLEVPEEELIHRMLQRGKEFGRADDNLETITRRLDVYHKQTKPLHDYYVGRGLYHRIDGHGEIAETSEQVISLMDGILPPI